MSNYNLDFEDHPTRINSLVVTQTPAFTLNVDWDGIPINDVSLQGFHKAQINMTLNGGAFNLAAGSSVTVKFLTDLIRTGTTRQIMLVQTFSNGGFLSAEVLSYGGTGGDVTIIFTNISANIYAANIRFQFVFL